MHLIDDEADRIAALAPNDRTSADIKTAIHCLTALNAINKDVHAEFREMRQEIRMLSSEKVNAIIAENTKSVKHLMAPTVATANIVNGSNDVQDQTVRKMHLAQTEPTTVRVTVEEFPKYE